ncbi:MAG: hypothetical protein AMXMBFR66_00820 [Pseudomonadota bacterium]
MAVRGARSADPRAVDVAALARSGGRLAGAWPLGELERLGGLLLHAADGAAAVVAWSAAGATRAVPGGEPEIWLELQARAPVRLQCQRCLQPLTQVLAVERRLRFVRGADEAERLDADSEDDVFELLARHDLRTLVEDELILALPLVPRHEVCPEPLVPAAADAPSADVGAGADNGGSAEHPFASLAALRRKVS